MPSAPTWMREWEGGTLLRYGSACQQENFTSPERALVFVSTRPVPAPWPAGGPRARLRTAQTWGPPLGPGPPIAPAMCEGCDVLKASTRAWPVPPRAWPETAPPRTGHRDRKWEGVRSPGDTPGGRRTVAGLVTRTPVTPLVARTLKGSIRPPKVHVADADPELAPEDAGDVNAPVTPAEAPDIRGT